MALHLYDTATRSTRAFVPVREGEVSMYLCGATVQAAPHVGHIRSGVSFDVLARWLRASGYAVTFCRNVTDIDDKIIAKGVEEGRPWWAVAAHYEREFSHAYDLLGCTPPTVEPRATGHVTQMVQLMELLISRGHAYAIDGDVYFDVRSFPEYGQLSGQRVDELQAAGDSTDSRKRDPRDFALWKSAREGEPSWPTPWGPGRPGWHLECSAMAHAYLGSEFDIHGGGLDLVFPHHENEVAQSKAAGDGFARYWLHNAWVTTSGEKMSKSLGNSLLVREVVKRVRPIELRYYLASAHYRSMIEFSFDSLEESAAGYRRLENFVRRATDELGPDAPSSGQLPDAFCAALDDDLSVSAALAALHDAVTAGNSLLAAGGAPSELAPLLGSVRSMLDVLGVDPLAEPWVSRDSGSGEERSMAVLDLLIQSALADRAAARANKDFAAADAIRDRLRDSGIVLEDTPTGVRWSLDGGH